MRFGKYPAVVLAFLAPVSLEAQNYANQLEIQNCGAYTVKKVILQENLGDGWSRKECWGNCGSSQPPALEVGRALCFDVTPGGTENGRYRLVMNILQGDLEKSDDTVFQAGADRRRVFRMKGTTRNNNRPKSRGYKQTRPASRCSKSGKRTPDFVNCENVGSSADLLRSLRGREEQSAGAMGN